MDSNQQAQLFDNIASSMEGVESKIIERALGHFEKIAPEYAQGVIEALQKKNIQCK